MRDTKQSKTIGEHANLVRGPARSERIAARLTADRRIGGCKLLAC